MTSEKEVDVVILEMPQDLVDKAKKVLRLTDSQQKLVDAALNSLNRMFAENELENQTVWKLIHKEMNKQGIKMGAGERVRFSYYLDKFYIEPAPPAAEKKKGE